MLDVVLQIELGRRVREALAARGIKSVAADGVGAPGVVVVYSPDPTDAGVGGKFGAAGVQIAGGVPMMCDHGTNEQHDGFRTFRLGLFGIDKLQNIDRTVALLEAKLDEVFPAAS